ncbi:MAG: sodium-dependent transporter [Gemmatimonadetes bacterium]|nr:sodium-dependent transporter [Gemmatimonadota bacterium]
MVGVAVGLGNVWRFPYLVGRFGGAAFVAVYVAIVIVVGIPALMAEWSLGRHSRRGTLGAYEAVGVPGGRALGRLLSAVVLAAVAYYNNAIGWVVFHAVVEAAAPFGPHIDGMIILPPETGFSSVSFGLQIVFTGLVLAIEGAVLLRGLRGGIERASRVLMPLLYVTLLLLIARSLTLPGAAEGLRWFLAFDPGSVTASVTLAALGQVVFSLALGGTFMVTYGSFLPERADIRSDAAVTAAGDTLAGLLAGLALFPAVFALGLEPGQGPGLLFVTVPELFARIPGGWALGALFYVALAGAALLSGIAAFEVLVVGLADVAGWSRRRAVWTTGAMAFVLALPPMVNLEVFIPWDLTFGSGAQTFGAVLAVATAGWFMSRAHLMRQLGGEAPSRLDRFLALWLRWVIPTAVAGAAAWWLLTEVLGAAERV